jgi:hypothetical protein
LKIRAARAGIENLIIPSEEAVQKAYKTARRGGGGVNRTTGENMNNSIGWGIGELEWEAWCRTLDTAVIKLIEDYSHKFEGFLYGSYLPECPFSAPTPAQFASFNVQFGKCGHTAKWAFFNRGGQFWLHLLNSFK